MRRWFFLLTFLYRITSTSGSYITLDDINNFDYDTANALIGRSRSNPSPSSRSFGFSLEGTRGVGQRCNDNERPCNNNNHNNTTNNTQDVDLYCADRILGWGRRCFPTVTTCLAHVVADFDAHFDFEAWKNSIFDDAGVTLQDLVTARLLANDFESFQDSDTFKAFVTAFQAHPPTEALAQLQEASKQCNVPHDSNNSSNNNRTRTLSDTNGTEISTTRGYDNQGNIPYLGLHIEVGVILDVAMTIFWAQGTFEQNEDEIDTNDVPTSFIRGTFGAEIGAGLEISMVVGFALDRQTPSDIPDSAFAFDAPELFLGWGIAFAILVNFNGLTSLEFTTGTGLSIAIGGVAYAITSTL